MFKRRILVCIIGLSVCLSSAIASSLKDFDVKPIEIGVNDLAIKQAPAENTINFVVSDFIISNIVLLDYGEPIALMVNSNKLVLSNVITVKFDNLAKVQNLNFERQKTL